MDVIEMVDGAAAATAAAAAAAAATAEDVESEVGGQATAAVVEPVTQVVVDDSWEEEEEEEGEVEVKAKVQVNLGTFVYPKLPFPYFFDLGLGIEPREEEKKKSEVPRVPVESPEKEGEVVEKELEEEKPQGGEDPASEEKKSDPNTIVVDNREDEKMDVIVEGEQKVVDKAAPSTSITTSPAAAVIAKEEDSTLLDLETRVTVIIPNGFIPREKPLYPKIWGGGLLDRTVPTPGGGGSGGGGTRRNGRGRSSNTKRALPRKQRLIDGDEKPIVPRRRRRVYTDDSDLFLCAIHSGWLTWTGAWAARRQGKDVKLDLRVLRCAGAPGGARWVECVAGRREDVVGRFLGGWGEKCFNEAGKGRKRQVDEKENDVEGDEDPSDGEDDGRGLVSAAWGTSHDGSAIEVLGVEFVFTFFVFRS
jgi:outer membrane biosynthesis protein TonB